MEDSLTIWSLTALSLYIIWALLIIAFFSLSRRFHPLLRVPRRLSDKIKRWLPLLELIAWISLLISAANHFLRIFPILAASLGIIILIVLLAIGWFFLRDVVAGIFLRWNGYIRRGDTLRINEISGKVRELGAKGITIELGSNESVFLSYSSIDTSSLYRSRRRDSRTMHTFQLSIPGVMNLFDLRQSVEHTIYLAPNTSLAEPPEIHIGEVHDGKTSVKISLYIIDPERLIDTFSFITRNLGAEGVVVEGDR